MARIESRASWGAKYRNGGADLSGLAEGVYIHHTATAYLSPTASVAEERQQMRNIEQIGKSRGFGGMSYNVIIFPSGRAYQGVSFDRRGAHTAKLNSKVRSLCFAGNYSTHAPTLAQLKTASEIFRDGKGRWWTKNAYVKGHRDNPNSSSECPGNQLYPLRGRIRDGYYLGAAPAQPSPVPSPAENVGNDRGTLARGSRGPRVESLQAFMRDRLRIKIDVDGSFGPGTEAAVKAWQPTVKLKSDGRVGPATLEVLRKLGWDEKSKDFSPAKPAPKPAPAKPAPAKPTPKPAPKPAPVKPVVKPTLFWNNKTKTATKGDRVRSLQDFLNRMYPSYSDLKEDGSYGPSVEKVVREFQERSKLQVDGRVGPNTRAALMRAGWRD